MTSSRARRPTPRRASGVLVGGLAVVAALAVVLGYRSLPSSPPAPPAVTVLGKDRDAPDAAGVAGTVIPEHVLPAPPSTVAPADVPRRMLHGAPVAPGGPGGGPEGVTVFDEASPSIAHLDSALLRALRAAAMDAADDGVVFLVNSGWRSPEEQARLFREAVSEYGSEEEAARWVASPATSAHVSGDAVDIGPSDASAWLSEYGAEYGLCQIYRNEPWHYELRLWAVDHGCPRMYADPTQDPRMQ